MAGRPRLDIGTFGEISTTRIADRSYRALARYRDDDGEVRKVSATGRSRVGETGGSLTPDSTFAELAELWMGSIQADAELSIGSKDTYTRELRTLLRPTWDSFMIREITTGRVDRFLKAQRAKSYARAKHSKTLMNMVMAFVVRHGAAVGNPVSATSKLRRPSAPPKALKPAQIARIRAAAKSWRTGLGVPGPKPDGQVRDLIEVMLGTTTRIGEALALRRCDVDMTADPPIVVVSGTIVTHKGMGAYRQPSPKSAESNRPIAVPPFAAEIIRRRLALTAGMDDHQLLFFSRRGTPLYPQNVRRTFREILVLAGLQGLEILLHSFRKTGATLVESVMGEQAAANLLGHADVATTRRHCIGRAKTANADTAEVLQSLAPDIEATLRGQL